MPNADSMVAENSTDQSAISKKLSKRKTVSINVRGKARQICYLILLVVSAGLWDWFPGNISEENLSSNLHPPNISEEEASFSYSETNKKHLFYLTEIFC